MLCYPTGAYYQSHPKINVQETFMKAMTPMAAILSGTIKDGSIAFHIDKTIGTGLDGCPLSSFTPSPASAPMRSQPSGRRKGAQAGRCWPGSSPFLIIEN